LVALASRWVARLPSTDAAYKTWFGTYTSSRYSTVQTQYNADSHEYFAETR
jgi:hypothetical protein